MAGVCTSVVQVGVVHTHPWNLTVFQCVVELEVGKTNSVSRITCSRANLSRYFLVNCHAMRVNICYK